MDLSILSQLLPLAGAGAQGYMAGTKQALDQTATKQVMALREADEMRAKTTFANQQAEMPLHMQFLRNQLRGQDIGQQEAEMNLERGRAKDAEDNMTADEAYGTGTMDEVGHQFGNDKLGRILGPKKAKNAQTAVGLLQRGSFANSKAETAARPGAGTNADPLDRNIGRLNATLKFLGDKLKDPSYTMMDENKESVAADRELYDELQRQLTEAYKQKNAKLIGGAVKQPAGMFSGSLSPDQFDDVPEAP